MAAAETVADMVVRMPQLTSVTHGMQQWLAVVCAWEVVEQSPQRTLPSGLPDVRTMTELDLSGTQECEMCEVSGNVCDCVYHFSCIS